MMNKPFTWFDVVETWSFISPDVAPVTTRVSVKFEKIDVLPSCLPFASSAVTSMSPAVTLVIMNVTHSLAWALYIRVLLPEPDRAAARDSPLTRVVESFGEGLLSSVNPWTIIRLTKLFCAVAPSIVAYIPPVLRIAVRTEGSWNDAS